MINSFPKRKENRLKNFDYGSYGYYFVTVCTKNKECFFWEDKSHVGADIIRPHLEHLSENGIIVDKTIKNIEKHYENVLVDKYVIMPNHIHLILVLSPPQGGRIISAPTISQIVGQMKRVVSRDLKFDVWQKSFHDHVIRNQNDYEKIWNYIDNNHMKWELDCFYTK
ncbi:MAG: transposase [Clostridia bacterium]